MLGVQNCGSWTVWITKQVKGIDYPSKAKEYNRLPLLPGVSVGGVGIGGVADYTLLPQAATLIAGAGGTIYQGAQIVGYGLYRGGEMAVDVGGTIIRRTEFLPGEPGGLVRWRY